MNIFQSMHGQLTRVLGSVGCGYTETAAHEKSPAAAHASCDGKKRATRISYCVRSIVFLPCLRQETRDSAQAQSTRTPVDSPRHLPLLFLAQPCRLAVAAPPPGAPALHENIVVASCRYQFPQKCAKMWPSNFEPCLD
jgi:hypothetical protein